MGPKLVQVACSAALACAIPVAVVLLSFFVQALAQFSTAAPLGKLLAQYKNDEEQLELLNILVWLLRRKCLLELHEFILLKPEWRADAAQKAGDSGDTSEQDQAAFRRILSYCHGQHHIEEIMWRESLSRQDITDFLAACPGLVTYVHCGDSSDKQ